MRKDETRPQGFGRWNERQRKKPSLLNQVLSRRGWLSWAQAIHGINRLASGDGMPVTFSSRVTVSREWRNSCGQRSIRSEERETKGFYALRITLHESCPKRMLRNNAYNIIRKQNYGCPKTTLSSSIAVMHARE